MRTSVLLLAVALLASACGSEKATSDAPPKVSPGAAAPAPGTELTVTLKKSPSAEPTTWTLTCDPAGGTHPDAAKACAQLAAAADPFGPVPAGQACTELYGGPETGTVTGTHQGKPVKAEFSRKNGCELERWSKIALLFGELPKVR